MLKSLKKIVTRRKKRIGRGYGSQKGGHTSTRGQKGQTSRAGNHRPRVFEGGQNPLIRKLPKIRGAKPKTITTAIKITQILAKNIYEIDTASLSSFTKDKNIKVVGSTNYEGYDLKKVTIKKGVPISKSLAKLLADAGAKVEE